MPLSVENFDEKQYLNFIEAKESIWKEFGFGPWAYFIDYKFGFNLMKVTLSWLLSSHRMLGDMEDLHTTI